MKYNIFGNYSSDIVEDRLFTAEYDESKTNIISAKEKIEANDMAWFYNNYFNCNKSYDKSKLITQEIKRTLNLTYFDNLEYKFGMNNLTNELNQQQRFYEEVFEEYKVDTGNRITLKSVNGEYNYDEGDYTLTYQCVADSVQTCNAVVDFVIDSFIERAKDFKVNVTKK